MDFCPTPEGQSQSESVSGLEDCGHQVCRLEEDGDNSGGVCGREGGGSQSRGTGWGAGSVGGLGARDRESGTLLVTHTRASGQLS